VSHHAYDGSGADVTTSAESISFHGTAEAATFDHQNDQIPIRPGDMRRVGVEQLPLTSHDGAEDGIRTRDHHLGKVMDLALLVCLSPLKCASVHPVSTPSTQSVAVVERSTIDEPSRIHQDTMFGLGNAVIIGTLDSPAAVGHITLGRGSLD
jgi:hypothetical protein